MAEDICHICNDRATGKHYGAISCDGCKGFFRRSIRKRHNYVCRFNKCCDVTRNQRNACRSCRLAKCLKAGMKQNAIQNERDAIGKRRKIEPPDAGDDFLDGLIRAEQLCQQLRSTVIKSTEQVSYDCGKMRLMSFRNEDDRRATLDDVGKSIHQQLVLLVEWAKSLPQFARLQMQDQAALLKAAAAQMIILGVAYRSRGLEDSICLSNDTLVPKDHAANVGDINCCVTRIIDEIVVPMRRMSIDLFEYVALKAIIFFNPVASSVVDTDTIEEARISCLRALQRRCISPSPSPSSSDAMSDCRSGRLLLLLPSLQAIAQQMVEDLQLARIFGLANLDSLMQELILHDERPDDMIQVEMQTCGHPQQPNIKVLSSPVMVKDELSP